MLAYDKFPCFTSCEGGNITVMIIKASNALSVLPLGKQGEHLARQILFDLSEWVHEYGTGTAELIYQRPGDEVPYPIAIVQEGDTLIWTLTATDTDKSGAYGKCEMRYSVGDTVAKSKVWRTWVDASMNTDVGEVPPESEKAWVEQVLAAGTDAKNAALRAEAAAIHPPYPNSNTSTWWVWNAEKGTYMDSGQPTCVADHRKLTNRDAEEQHPIQAITNLDKELSARVKTANVITAMDIITMMGE